MVAYTIQALSVILSLSKVPSIQGQLTFKPLWDVVHALLLMLQKIKHLDHLGEGTAGMMMEAAAYALVSIRPWLVPDRMGEVLTIP